MDDPAAEPSPPVAPPEALGWDREARRFRRAVFGPIVVLFVLGAIVAAVAVLVLVPQLPPRPKRRACLHNMERIAEIYAECAEDPSWTPRSGPALLLGWRRDAALLRTGDEHALMCPGDQSVSPADTPEARARYDGVDLDDPPDDLCSYAVRDFARFPVDPARLDEEPIAACVGRFADATWQRFHRTAFFVAFADGSARELDDADVGLAPGATLVVGPDSPSPLLRVLCFRPGRTERAGR